MKHPFWVLDYAFNEAGLTRVGSPGRPWQPRASRTAHLYPPGTVYWKEYPRHAEPVSFSAYIMFTGGDGGGLGRLIGKAFLYARFLDPKGTVGSLLENIARIGHTEGERGSDARRRCSIHSWDCSARASRSTRRPGESATRAPSPTAPIWSGRPMHS